jgi:hypothetical protein
MLTVMRYSPADVRAVCKQRDAWWTVLLVDPVACRLVRFVANRTSTTPNQLTGVAFVLGLCAAGCFATGEAGYLALGALLFHLGFVVDCMDGKLARLKRNGTTFGLWLDFSLDQLRMLICSFALSWGLYQQTGRVEAGFLAAVIIAFDLVRYLNGPQVAKVRRAMRDQVRAAISAAHAQEQAHGEPTERGEAQRRALERLYARSAHAEREDLREQGIHPEDQERPGTRDGTVEDHRPGGPGAEVGGGADGGAEGRRGGEAQRRRAQAREQLHQGFAARFPWYASLRGTLIAHRIRTHIVSGIEYQMAVFVVGPLLAALVGASVLPYVVGIAGAAMLLFECVLVYKLWMSTRDFARVMRRIRAPRTCETDDRVGAPSLR